MAMMLEIGLAVSLGGPLLYVLVGRKLAFESLSLPGRLLHWLVAAGVLAIAARGDGAWLVHIGARPPTGSDLLATLVAIVVMLAGGIACQVLLGKLGFKGGTQRELLKKLFRLSAPYRLLIVITAAVTEEVLFRGYAIGIGQQIWGSLDVALIVSLFVFVAAHYTQGAKAMVPIFWVTLVMSLLFVHTGNLFACIAAHFVLDALGLLVAPWIAARRRVRMASEG